MLKPEQFTIGAEERGLVGQTPNSMELTIVSARY